MVNSAKIVYKSRFIGKFLSYFVTRFQLSLISFYGETEFLSLLQSIRKEIDLAFYPNEAFVIYSIAKSQSKLSGDMAEVGVYQGGSAKIICEVKGNNNLHLFDTFEGLPEVTDKDTHFGIKYWNKNEFDNTSEESVKEYLKTYPNVFLYKGIFPETASPILNLKFSFVHLDVDLYQSTIDCLNFFFPRLVSGGVILTHDYHTRGVRQAFDEFFQEKKIPIISINGTQCMVINI